MHLTHAPAPTPQTSCDPSGGTYESWVHGRALGETATDQAGRAQAEAQGGHFQLYQPGHVSAGELKANERKGFVAGRRVAGWLGWGCA